MRTRLVPLSSFDGRIGFTIIELLVCITILGLLVAIIVPAVQSSRETASRLNCQNNLRQFGLSLSSFASDNGNFPTANVPVPGFWRMLPYLDQAPLYQELIEIQKSSNPRFPKTLNVPEFRCPSDAMHTYGQGSSNYLFNSGTMFSIVEPCNGFRNSHNTDTRPSDISDGLSNTAAMSERLVGVMGGSLPPSTLEMEHEPRRYFWYTAIQYNLHGDESKAVEECRVRRTTVFPQVNGFAIAMYDESSTSYDHLLLPNEPACYNSPEGMNFGSAVFLIPPSSMHAGGINVLFADGSVHFVNNFIDEEMWQAVGTRNGHESLGDLF